jgi:hypothetical protein
MPDRDSQSNVASHAITENVRLLNSQLFKKSGRVVRHLLIGQRAINVCRVPVPL